MPPTISYSRRVTETVTLEDDSAMLSVTFITGFATVFGTAEGIRAAQAKSRREEHRQRRNNLYAYVPKSSQFSSSLHGRSVVLSGDRLFLDTGSSHNTPFGHPFEGYFLPYPDSRFSGLVSTITDEAPIMNWIFVDRDLYQIKFGNRLASEGNFTGPWDCTRQEHRLTFGGWEGFCAVYEEDMGVWGMYYDVDGDRLRAKLGPDKVIIQLLLERREARTRRPAEAAQAEEEAAARMKAEEAQREEAERQAREETEARDEQQETTSQKGSTSREYSPPPPYEPRKEQSADGEMQEQDSLVEGLENLEVD